MYLVRASVSSFVVFLYFVVRSLFRYVVEYFVSSPFSFVRYFFMFLYFVRPLCMYCVCLL